MPTPAGFSNMKMRGPSRHQTIQTLGSDRAGIPTAQMYLYEKTPVAIEVVSVEKSSLTKQTKKEMLTELLIEFDGNHNAQRYDIMRMMDGDLEGWEFEILKIVSPTEIIVHNIGDLDGVETLPAAGDQVKTLRWTTALSDQSGALQVSQGPLQFVRNSATTTVNQDDADPTNNRPLPAGMYFYKDGVAVPVADDSGDPNNVAAIPVLIKAVDGTNITINAGDINVQTSSEGVNFDSMRIGDGSGVFLKIEADGSINVLGIADVITELTTLNGVDFSTEATLEACRALLESIDGFDFATDTTLEAVRALVESLDGKDFATETTLTAAKAVLDSIEGKDFATQTTLAAAKLVLDNILTALGTLNGKDFATQTTLAALNGKFGTLGQKASAGSAPVVLSTEQEDMLNAILQNSYSANLSGDETQLVDNVTPAVFETPSPTTRYMMIVNNASDNANRIRYGLNVPSWVTPVGAILGVGGSTPLLPAGDVMCIAENADSTADVTVLWF